MTTTAMDIRQKELPAGWKWVKLGDVCHVNPKRPSMDWKPDTRTTFVPMPSVDDQTGAITQPEEKDYSAISKGYTYFEEGDVLFAKITPCMQNGKHAIATKLLNGFAFGSTEFHVLRPQEEIISGWVHKFLRQPSILAEAKLHFRGSVGQQRVPKEFLGELPIPLPRLEEQRRIAAILNEQIAAVEKAKKAAEERLEAAKALPAAYLRDVFPSSEDELPDAWAWVKLGEVCNRLHQGLNTAASKIIFVDEGFPIIQTRNVDNGKIDITRDLKFVSSEDWKRYAPQYQPKVGDVFFTNIGTIGKTAIVESNEDYLIHWNIFKIRPKFKMCTSEFLKATLDYLTNSKIFADMQVGGTVKFVSKKMISSVDIGMPPIQEQKIITSELSEKITAASLAEQSIQQELDTIAAMPASLLRKAFSGEL